VRVFGNANANFSKFQSGCVGERAEESEGAMVNPYIEIEMCCQLAESSPFGHCHNDVFLCVSVHRFVYVKKDGINGRMEKNEIRKKRGKLRG
jgi:hypothetical protein